MKKILITILSLSSFFAFPAIADSATSNQDKYSFTDLEQVDNFLYWQINGWQAIDARSLIVNFSPSRSYLVILDRNLRALMFTEQVQFSSRNSRVRANIDMVNVFDPIARPTRIKAIYLLPDREARQAVRAKIRSEEIDKNALNGMNGEVILDQAQGI